MDSPGFDLTRRNTGEKSRVWALDSFPPNDIILSKIPPLYLERGTPDDCSCLARQQPELCSASKCLLGSPGLRVSSLDAPVLGGSSHGSSADVLPLGQSTVGPKVESLAVFLTNALGENEGKEKRVKRLVDVLEGFAKAKVLPDGPAEDFWSQWPRMFKSEREVGSKVESTPPTFEARCTDRLCRLKQIRQDTRNGSWEVSRLWLLCVAHEVQYISQWEGIDAYTSVGVDRPSAAATIVKRYLGEKELSKKCRNITHLMKIGGPAAVLLDDGGRPRSVWERGLTLDDMTVLYKCKEEKLPHLYEQTRRNDRNASDSIEKCLLAYGLLPWELLSSKTDVAKILRAYLLPKRQHAGDELGDLTNKRQHVYRPGASTPRPDHDLSAPSSNQLSPGRNYRPTSTRISKAVESTLRSDSLHLIPSNTKNETRNLTDRATANILEYCINSPDDFTDCATANILGHCINSLDDFTDRATANILGHCINNSDDFTDCATANILGHCINSLDDFTDRATANILGHCINSLDDFTDPVTTSTLEYTINSWYSIPDLDTASHFSNR